MNSKTGYPSDVTDDEWSFCLPYLLLCKEDAKQRVWPIRTIFNAVRYVVRYGCPWRALPNDFPPYRVVHAQLMRWIEAKVFESMVHDLRSLMRMAQGRNKSTPSACIIDSRTLQSVPESGPRAGYDAGKKKRGSKVHTVVDTLGHVLALRVTPANEQDRDQVAALTADIQEVTGQSVEVAFVDQAYTGEDTANAAKQNGIELLVVKRLEGLAGFIVLPKRWIVERTQGCLGRMRRLTRDFERLPTTLAGMHWLAALIMMLGWTSINTA